MVICLFPPNPSRDFVHSSVLALIPRLSHPNKVWKQGYSSLMSLVTWLHLIVLSLPTSTGAADTLATVDEEHPTNRFNDAKCDRLGKLWGGTMGYEDKPGVFSPHMGSLYSYDGGTV